MVILMVNIEELKEYGLEVTDEMKDGKVIIDVYTTWCGPCKWLSPILEKLEKEGLFKLLKVDLDQNRPLGSRFGITAIPTLLFFNEGRLLENTIEVQGQPFVRNGLMVGAAGEPVLKEIVSKM
jgi:thioredoxin 1